VPPKASIFEHGYSTTRLNIRTIAWIQLLTVPNAR
jgi:hypothetical protein